MKSIKAFIIISSIILYSCIEKNKEIADTVYTNGKIYTVNETQPWAEAVAIKGGKYIFIGTSEDAKDLIGESTKVVDLEGKFAMPGLHDTHVHPALVYTYEESGELLFPESTSPDEIIELIKDYAEKNPKLEVIRAQKWGTGNFPGGKATKEWLDPHFPDRAIYVIDETGHNAVINSAALKLAGITKDTPDPEFGSIDRNPITGEPTGYLSETAMGLIGKFVKRPDVDANYRGISQALEAIRSYGITSIVDALIGPNSLEAYRKLEEEGKLNMRVDAMINFNDFQIEATTVEESEALIARRSELKTPLIDIGIKYFADGTPLSYTALMVEPYHNDSSTHGSMTIGPKQLEHIKWAHSEGIQVMAHATTDGTTRTLLDAIEQAQTNHPNPSLRHHIGHLLTVTKEDIPRFKELNVTAEFSPIWFYPTPLGEIASEYIGPERYSRWQAIKEFVDAGVLVSIGSDWPAGTPNADPWKGVEGMITRKDPFTNTGEKLGEGVDLETALKIVTINGAKAMMQEDNVGSIELGKFADMIVLDRNLFEIPTQEISETKVLTTIFGGKTVYQMKK